MADFWKRHCKDLSDKEMMLNSAAPELTKEEVPEILSYLPDYNGKVVLELGAGIGRYTSELAKGASKVIAVDFMADFLEKNKKTNQHLGNCEFKHVDATKLEMPDESVDFIFTNWLLMYLEDSEVEALFEKQLRWLKPGGFLFIRESCWFTSSDYLEGHNPTKYRDPDDYEAFYSVCSIPCDATNFYGYDLVLSKPISAFIKKSKLHNQIFWLLEKVRKDNSKHPGYKSFQDFLDNRLYSTERILMYEKAFGRTFVSTGGFETTKEFVDSLNLQTGQRVLDVGGGIGGSAFYMAKNFGVSVVSIDLSSNMYKIALERAREVDCGPDQVQFELADATKRDYPAASFDVIYSRDVILHVEDKLSLFKKFLKLLKPGGKVLITDYCCGPSDHEHSDDLKDYASRRRYNLLSVEDFGKVLGQAGFINVRTEDKRQRFAETLQTEISKLADTKNEFIQEFDEDGFNFIVNGWKDKLERIEKGDQTWGFFYAEKA